MSTEVMFAPVN